MIADFLRKSNILDKILNFKTHLILSEKILIFQ